MMQCDEKNLHISCTENVRENLEQLEFLISSETEDTFASIYQAL